MKHLTILLDVDGTLVDSNDLHAQAWCQALHDYGYSLSFPRVRGLIGMGADKIVPQLTGLAPESETANQISAHRKQVFLSSYLPQVFPFPRIRELLTRMRSDGCQLVAASSASAEELDKLLERADVQDLIDKQTSADDVDRSKPDPEVIRAALDKAQAVPADAVMIGDTPYDVEAATRAGVRIVAVQCGGYAGDELRGAAAQYRDPQDLLQHYDDSPLWGSSLESWRPSP